MYPGAFTEGETTATVELTEDNIKKSDDISHCLYFTLDGRRLDQPQKGFNVVRETLKNGQVRTVKRIMK